MTINLFDVTQLTLKKITSFIKEIQKECNWADPTLAIGTYRNDDNNQFMGVLGIFVRDFQRFLVSQYF